MLRGLILENFKAFSGRRVIPFSPLTLIFGENSSGKSTIIQSLLLLKQTASRPILDDSLVVARGYLTDLGNFESMVFGHDLDRSIEIAPILDPTLHSIDDWPDRGQGAWQFSEFAKSPGADLRAGMGIRFKTGASSRILETDGVRFYFTDMTTPTYTLVSSPEARTSLPRRARDRNARIAALKENPELLKATSWIELGILPVGRPLEEELDQLEPMHWEPISSNAQYFDRAVIDERSIAWENWFLHLRTQTDLSFQVGPHESASLAEFLDFIRQTYSDAKLLLRNLSLEYAHGWPAWAPSDEMLDGFHDQYGQALVPDLGELSIDVSRFVRDLMERTSYLGPIREMPDRVSVYDQTSAPELSKSGGGMANLLYARRDDDALLQQIDARLKQFSIGYRLNPIWKLNSIPGVGDLFALQLQDTRTRTSVSFQDVGAGIGQVLPIVVQSILAERSLLLIEQPEIHLHPRLQSELGDLFLEAALGPRKNTVVVETHSEHLLLRVMKRLRQTSAGANDSSQLPVHPNDVCVLYVQATENGSIVRRLRLSEDGDFLDPWPNGFFEEGFRELFG